MKLSSSLSLLLVCASLGVQACAAPSSALQQRADKIVASLSISDAGQAQRVGALLAAHYAALASVHEARDKAIAAAKAGTGEGKEAVEAALARVRAEAEAKQNAVHAEFFAALGRELSPAQVEGVKDGMTYSVAPRTYAVYLKMMPDLTEEQKAQIHAWLYEAREHALTAGSSDEKHAWFGKYKGRINNYLSKAGYNLKDAEKNLKP